MSALILSRKIVADQAPERRASAARASIGARDGIDKTVVFGSGVYYESEMADKHSTIDERLESTIRKLFWASPILTVDPAAERLPLVAANVATSTRSFSRGQLVFIYDVYWGMNERAKVVGRFRRKRDWIRGVVPIKSLDNFRPKMVHNPFVIRKLHGEIVDGRIFPRFLPIDMAWKNDPFLTMVGLSGLVRRLKSLLRTRVR
jgi:hypothetical protein